MATEIVGNLEKIVEKVVYIRDDDGDEIEIDMTGLEMVLESASKHLNTRVSFVYNNEGCQWKQIAGDETQSHLAHDHKRGNYMLSPTAMDFLLKHD